MPLYVPGGGGGAVSSVNGRSGAVTGVVDYSTTSTIAAVQVVPLLIDAAEDLPAGTPAGMIVVVKA